MRSVAALAAITLLAFACGGGSTGHTPSPGATVAETPSATPSGPAPVTSFGLLLSAGTLEMITPTGSIAAHASVAAPSVHTCGQNTAAVLQPPVSASDTRVYYRDGNTRIKFLTPEGETGNVTTVPGSATKISFFSVSPDDTRIAVLVEDLSPATTIKLALYVEDLTRHTNHSLIFDNTVPKFKNATTLWPMGWHDGLLVLAVFPPCTFEPAGLVPIEWHVASAVSGNRVAKIGNPCIPSYWPSPAGVLCLDLQTTVASLYPTSIHDWTGKVVANTTAQDNEFQSGLSPSGRGYFMTPRLGTGAPPPGTKVINLGTQGPGRPGGGGAFVEGHSACLWIDEDHLLAPDSVITFESTFSGTGNYPTSVIPLPASGQCAGRFPGGL